MERSRPVEPVGLSIDDIIIATGLGRTSVYNEIAAGRLRTYKVGRRRFATPEALRQWAAAHESRAA